MATRLNALANSKGPRRQGQQRPAQQRGATAGSDPGRYTGDPGTGGAAGDPATMTPKQRRQAAHQAQAAAGRDIQSKLPENDPRRYMNPRNLYKRSRGRNIDSPYAPAAVMQNVQMARKDLGLADTQEELTQHWKQQLEAGAPVDYQEQKRETEEWRPQINQLQEYAQSHLGQGLMPEEEAAIRGRMQDALASSQQQATDQASSEMAARGLTGSGVASARALQLERAQQQGGQDIEREITLQDLARKGELEGLAQNVGGLSLGEAKLSEAGREYDVTAEANRQAQVEQGMSDITGLESGQFTDIRDYAESKQQAKASRAASRKAAREAQPGTMETIGMIAGAIL